MKILIYLSNFLFFTLFTLVSCSKSKLNENIPISATGETLKQFYLSQDVEHLWLDGKHVNWETGIIDDPKATSEAKSHCSSFVASVCKRKNIYILRPPEHVTLLLANAQHDWLLSNAAKDSGWVQLYGNTFEEGQKIANSGKVVVAVYRNPNPEKSGHIAFVMPTVKSTDDIAAEGPTLIQAGTVNSNSISLKEGFKYHITNWSTALNSIQFFSYQK